MIRLTGQQIFDATQTLAMIINDRRPMPGKGTYRVTKMHKALFAEFTTLNDARTAKIQTYGFKQPTLNGVLVEETPENISNPELVLQDAVPAVMMPEFLDWWKDIASVEADVNVEPIPIEQLCTADGESSITFAEFTALGDLVSD